MTDDAWSVLEPRLLAQLPAAQQAEADHVSRVASLPTRTTDRRHPDANSKEAREVMDREWEESQRPIRDKLNDIADDFINQDWDRGNAITYENSPKFAADLLAYVRSSYYADSKPPQHGTLGTNGTEIRPKLVLDNMKWVYDNKVKPLTEPYRKEIFICYGSGCESNTRFYGFEGVIQHYGAKHTNTFSAGNVVVAWREAEWPEEPPYHPDPVSIKHTHHASSSMGGYGAWNAGFSRAGTSTPHMHPHLPQTSPGPYGYAGQYNGPFAPPQTPIPGYGYPQPYAPPMEGYAHQTMGPPVYGSQPAQQSYMPSPALINPAIAPPPAMPPPSQGPHETVQTGMDDAEYSTSSFDKQVSTVIGMTQDSWKQTSGIKDLPNSLRIYVLLHRVISKFQVEFNHEPNLNHFIDALSNHEMPKALKNAPGLSCNACQIESSQHLTGAYYSKSEERKTYTVLNLLTHFKGHHLLFQSSVNPHGHSARPLDWKEDMIELPSERFISGLIHAPGMDDEKLLMIATVFPKLFPTPLPKIGVIDSHRVTSPASSGSKDAVDTANTAETTADKLEKAVAASSVDVSKESSLPPKALQAEYDQLQPAISAETNEVSRLTNRKRSYDESPPAERRQRYYTEPRYYVGSLLGMHKHWTQANNSLFSIRRTGSHGLENIWNTHRVQELSTPVQHMMSIPAAGRSSAIKKECTGRLQNSMCTHINVIAVMAIESLVPTHVRSATMVSTMLNTSTITQMNLDHERLVRVEGNPLLTASWTTLLLAKPLQASKSSHRPCSQTPSLWFHHRKLKTR